MTLNQTISELRQQLDEALQAKDQALAAAKTAQQALEESKIQAAINSSNSPPNPGVPSSSNPGVPSSSSDFSGRHFKLRDISAVRTVKYNDHNWLSWSKETKILLHLNGLWDGVITNVNALDPSFQHRNMQACLVITSGLQPHIVSQVRSFESAKDMWDFLRPKDCLHTLHVKRQQLLGIKIDSFKSVSQYLGNAKDLYDEINSMSHSSQQMQEADFVQVLANGLRSAKGNAYHRLIERMDELYRGGQSNVYTFQWFRSELMAKELFVKSHSRRYKGGPEQQSDSTAFLADEPEIICFKCDQPGHKANVCPQLRRRPNRGGGGNPRSDKNKGRGNGRKGKGGRKAINLLACVSAVCEPDIPDLVSSSDEETDSDEEPLRWDLYKTPSSFSSPFIIADNEIPDLVSDFSDSESESDVETANALRYSNDVVHINNYDMENKFEELQELTSTHLLSMDSRTR